jgi:hypothetical protein
MLPVKDLMEVAEGAVTAFTVASAAVGYLITRKKRQDAGTMAMDQINTLATNHFPHMANDIKSLSEKSDTQIEILRSINTNIVVLCDRPRVSPESAAAPRNS